MTIAVDLGRKTTNQPNKQTKAFIVPYVHVYEYPRYTLLLLIYIHVLSIFIIPYISSIHTVMMTREPISIKLPIYILSAFVIPYVP